MGSESEPKPPPRQSPNQLLVEGKDDLHSVAHLLERHGFQFVEANPRAPFIKDCGGYDGVLAAVDVMAKESHYENVGVIVDANQNPVDRWAQIRDGLTKVGRDLGKTVVLPKQPEEGGFIARGFFPKARIGLWLMPNNQSSGTLEDFLETLVPEGNACWVHANLATLEARSHGAMYSDAAFKKARLHAWLAWQEEPGLPFGTALKSCYLKSDSPFALTFVEWFKRLFA